MTLDSLSRAARAEHLTDALRRSGALGEARVCDVAVASSRPTLLSQITRLRLTYDGAAAGAPSTVILKTGLPDRAGAQWNGGRQEVAFYTQVASAMSARLAPRCFEAHWDADTNAWHLLLEDLTDTHVIATKWPLPPTMEQCESILRALARLHAEWWDDPRLGVSVGTWLDADAMDQQLQRLADRFELFTDRLGTACHANGAICTSDFSTRRPVSSHATTRIVISRSFTATPTSGTISCRRTAGTTSGFSIGMPGASEWRRTTSRT